MGCAAVFNECLRMAGRARTPVAVMVEVQWDNQDVFDRRFDVSRSGPP